MDEQGDWKDGPPWERPGAFRLDCEPHRGALLARMGVASALAGILSLLLLEALGVANMATGVWSVAFLVPAIAALPLAVATRAMARRDLGLMDRGLVDPEGEPQARVARKNALAGLVCALLGVGWGCYVLLTVLVAGPPGK